MLDILTFSIDHVLHVLPLVKHESAANVLRSARLTAAAQLERDLFNKKQILIPDMAPMCNLKVVECSFAALVSTSILGPDA